MYYGGRGIKICDRWLGLDGFKNFLTDMGSRPTPEHSIERKDNDGDYGPGNCVWATDAEQARNSSGTVLNEVSVSLMRHMARRGARQCDLAHAFGVNRNTVHRAVKRVSWGMAS